MKQKSLKLATLIIALLALTCLAVACGSVTHKVTFDADGGSAVADVSVADGVSMGNAPHSVKDGYQLKGWSNDDGKTLYDFSAPVTAPLSLKAVWEKTADMTAETVTVTFKDNDTVVAQVTIEKGGKVYAPDLSREGFELTWKNNGQSFDFDTAVNADITLLAEFAPRMLTVTVIDADGLKLDDVDVAYGQAADLSALEPVHWAYPEIFTFSGWDKPIDCIKEDMTVKAVYSYKALPDELFYFNPLKDGTYEIALKRTLDFRSMQLDGAWGVPETFNNKPVSKIASYGLSSLYKGFKNIDLLYIP